MAYLKNKQYSEIYEASKSGNQGALEIMQGLRNGMRQQELDDMVYRYYNPIQEALDVPVENDVGLPLEQVEAEEPQLQAQVEELPNAVVDLSNALDKDFEDLLDENEIGDTSFYDFLGNKRKDSLRAKKNSDYFKAYSQEDRQSYMNNKINGYKGKFNTKLNDIERKHRDMDGALKLYAQRVNESVDDNVDLDMNVANDAYDELTQNDNVMHGFGRGWDDIDTNNVVTALKDLVSKYGKKNIIAALNTLMNDNNNYRDFMNNQVDSEIGRYSKSIENLLK